MHMLLAIPSTITTRVESSFLSSLERLALSLALEEALSAS
jgi:hypothetical protein